MSWFLVVISLHMLSEPNVTGPIQVMKFTDESACEGVRTAASTDGVFSVCTSNQTDVSGFIAAMNCRKGEIRTAPGGAPVQAFECAPYISVRK
jgi:hypothetical protein